MCFRKITKEDWIELEIEKGFDRLYEKLGDDDWDLIDDPVIRNCIESKFIKEAEESYEDYLYEKGASQFEDRNNSIYL